MNSLPTLKILDRIYDTLVKMEERLENIEAHLKKYEPKEEKDKRYTSALWISLPDSPGKLGEVTSLIGMNKGNIFGVEMTEKKPNHINFMFDIQIDDLKNFTKLISELKQKEFNFRIIRHKKKHALLQRFFKSFKKN